jgi:hypothetical protein
VIGGTIPERLEAIVSQYRPPVVCSVDEAVALASGEYAKIHWTPETQRTTSPELVPN